MLSKARRVRTMSWLSLRAIYGASRRPASAGRGVIVRRGETGRVDDVPMCRTKCARAFPYCGAPGTSSAEPLCTAIRRQRLCDRRRPEGEPLRDPRPTKIPDRFASAVSRPTVVVRVRAERHAVRSRATQRIVAFATRDGPSPYMTTGPSSMLRRVCPSMLRLVWLHGTSRMPWYSTVWVRLCQTACRARSPSRAGDDSIGSPMGARRIVLLLLERSDW